MNTSASLIVRAWDHLTHKILCETSLEDFRSALHSPSVQAAIADVDTVARLGNEEDTRDALRKWVRAWRSALPAQTGDAGAPARIETPAPTAQH